MAGPNFLSIGGTARAISPNRWDVVAIPLLLGALALAFIGVRQMQAPIEAIQQTPISLDPTNLPEYALRTVLRMLAGLVASLVFTFIYGTLAAKNRRLELVLVPILDILQSVPILGYISFTVVFFMSLFPGSVMGAELACVFAIFTSQAWNMTFSFYQSLRTLPHDLDEAARSFHLTAWQRFWRLEVPFAMPGLIWNMMMSMSGAWFFVVASEAITVGDKTITLPGIGAYVATALDQKSLSADGWAILAMTVVILIYDNLLFRPLVAWADKFRAEQTAAQIVPESWVLNLGRRARFLGAIFAPAGWAIRRTSMIRLVPPKVNFNPRVRSSAVDGAWYVIVAFGAVWIAVQVFNYLSGSLTWGDVGEVCLLTTYTLIRVVVLIALATAVWLPLGIWIGLRPRIAEKIQPLAQFLAAFPANMVFPLAVMAIVYFRLNVDIWVSFLMILGTQWYILFNVIAGATAFPTDLREAASMFGVRGWRWWRKVAIPGVFPYYITGAITASGGAWNASIVGEYVKWGDTTLAAHGVGRYIAEMTEKGDYPRIVLGIVVMSLFVTVFNRVLWRPLYQAAARQIRLD
jgi:NitT/TauT family transport system permease protein